MVIVDGELTEEKILELVRGVEPPVFVYASPQLMAEVDVLLGDRMELVPASRTYGVPLKKVATSVGDVFFMKFSSPGRIGFAVRHHGVLRGD